MPVILAVHGFVFTGALELVLGAGNACGCGYCTRRAMLTVRGCCPAALLPLPATQDLIVAGESTVFQDTHAKFGLVPTWGLPARLPRKVGQQRANQIMMLGQPFSAQQAEAWGLINAVVPDGEVAAEARLMALQSAALSRSAVTKTKRLMVEANGSSQRDALAWMDRFHPGQGSDIKERIQLLYAKSSRGKKSKGETSKL